MAYAKLGSYAYTAANAAAESPIARVLIIGTVAITHLNPAEPETFETEMANLAEQRQMVAEERLVTAEQLNELLTSSASIPGQKPPQ
jgi:hypothetical protein